MSRDLRKVRNVGLVVLLVGLFAFSARGAGVAGAGVTGVWKLHVTNQGDGAPDFSLTLKADGHQLTGTLTGASAPDEQHTLAKGRIASDQISFEIYVKDQGGSTHFTARVIGNQMKGTAVVPDGQSFPFTATRQVLAPGRGPGAVRPANLPGSNPHPDDAQKAILAAFDHYDVVGGLSPAEGSKDTDDFILALIRNPAFPDKVNDIAVEHGNSLYQPLLDRYIAGEDVPFSEARKVWRNTTQPPGGFSLLYEELFPLVRRINRRLPPNKKLRVLACDPPVDWSRVKSAEDMKPFEQRDANIASVMEREVLSKHRKALMLMGVNHMKHGTGGAVGLYERKYPNVTFVISAHVGFGNGNPALEKDNDTLEKRMASWPVPSLVTMKGTWLADLPSAYFAFQDDDRGGRGDRGIDGYLYLGPRDLLLSQPIPARIAEDQAYMDELRRRAALLHDSMRPEIILQQELESSVFTYDKVDAATPARKP